eukprot:gene12192-25610_t
MKNIILSTIQNLSSRLCVVSHTSPQSISSKILLSNKRTNEYSPIFNKCIISYGQHGRQLQTSETVKRGELLLSEIPYATTPTSTCNCQYPPLLVEHITLAWALSTSTSTIQSNDPSMNEDSISISNLNLFLNSLQNTSTRTSTGTSTGTSTSLLCQDHFLFQCSWLMFRCLARLPANTIAITQIQPQLQHQDKPQHHQHEHQRKHTHDPITSVSSLHIDSKPQLEESISPLVKLQETRVGYAVCIHVSALNHSCQPNSMIRCSNSTSTSNSHPTEISSGKLQHQQQFQHRYQHDYSNEEYLQKSFVSKDIDKDIAITPYKCDHNYSYSCNDEYLKSIKIDIVATENMNKDKECCISYGVLCNQHSLLERRKILTDQYVFICNCDICVREEKEEGYCSEQSDKIYNDNDNDNDKYSQQQRNTSNNTSNNNSVIEVEKGIHNRYDRHKIRTYDKVAISTTTIPVLPVSVAIVVSVDGTLEESSSESQTSMSKKINLIIEEKNIQSYYDDILVELQDIQVEVRNMQSVIIDTSSSPPQLPLHTLLSCQS